MKDRVHAILGVYGIYDPAVVTNPSRLQTIAKHLKDEMDDAEAARRAALDAERLRQEARQRQNVRQEGALGAIPQGYGVVAPRVAGANEEMQRHFQQAADLLAQNPRSQNNHFRPVVPEEPPRGGDENGRARTVVTPVPFRGAVEGAAAAAIQRDEQRALELPTLDEFAAMPVPPLAPNAGANLPAEPGQQVGAANNGARARAIANQRFIANAATAGVGQPIVVDEADATAMRRTRRIDNIEAIDGLNRAMMATTKLIGEAIRARGERMAAAGGRGDGGGDLDRKLESLHKRRKLAIEVGDQRSIEHCDRIIHILEEKEAREIEGAGGE